MKGKKYMPLIFLVAALSVFLITPIQANPDTSENEATVNNLQYATVDVKSQLNFIDYKVTYTTAKIERFLNTLITYELPENIDIPYKYVSIVMKNSEAIAYVFNSTSDTPVIYAHSKVVGSYISKPYTQQSGNASLTDVRTAASNRGA